MVLEIILLLVGIVLVLWGADRFTDGASGLARKWHVSMKKYLRFWYDVQSSAETRM